MQLVPGTPIGGGKYTLIEQIGEGGQSEVWRAQQHGLEGFAKDVVLKFILPDQPTGHLRDMLVQEAQLVVRLTHPNIVQIFDIAQEGERLYLAMEHIKGGDLGGLLSQYQSQHGTPLPWPLAAAVMAQVCDGLHHAHTLTHDGQPLGIIHRDLKPENILLNEDGFLKLIDFGIAKFSDSTKTKTGSLKGTPAYMSPEQITARRLDHRSDLFPIGSILYELCCGERPFEAPDVFTLLFLINQQEPTPLSERTKGLPAALLRLVQQLMAKDPAQRPIDAKQVRRTLRTLLMQHGYTIEREELATLAQALRRGQRLPPTMEDWRDASVAGAMVGHVAPSDTVPNPPTEAVLEQLAALQADEGTGSRSHDDPQAQSSSPYQDYHVLPSGQQIPEDEGFGEAPQAPLEYPETTLQPTAPLHVPDTTLRPMPAPSALQAQSHALSPAPSSQVHEPDASASLQGATLPLQPYRAASAEPSGPVAPDPLDETLQTPPSESRHLWLAGLALLLLCGVGVGLWVLRATPLGQPSSTGQSPDASGSQPRRPAPIPSLPPLAARSIKVAKRPAMAPVPRKPSTPDTTPAPAAVAPQPRPTRRRLRRRRRRKRYGQLRIEIEPKCKLYEGSRWLGHSNGLVLRRPYGRFRFHCVCASCRFRRTYAVRIRRRRQIFRRRYRPGKLFLSSRPWSAIHLAPFGKIGYTQQYLKLYEGRYTFTLYKRGKPSQKKRISVVLRPGKVTRWRPVIW